MRLILLTTVLFSTQAVAQPNVCPAYVGQTISLSSFDNVAAVLDNVPKQKGEYETTEVFESRVQKALVSVPNQVIVSYRLDAKYLTYDADSSSLNIGSFALKNQNTSYDQVFGYDSPFYTKVEYGYNNLHVVISGTEAITGSYRGSNSFGVTAKVSKIARLNRSVFEGEIGFSDSIWAAENADHTLGKIPMSVAEAQQLKANGRAAVVFSPKWPFYAEGVKSWDPSLDRPTDIKQLDRVIIADIKCVLLMTASNKVLASFETK